MNIFRYCIFNVVKLYNHCSFLEYFENCNQRIIAISLDGSVSSFLQVFYFNITNCLHWFDTRTPQDYYFWSFKFFRICLWSVRRGLGIHGKSSQQLLPHLRIYNGYLIWNTLYVYICLGLSRINAYHIWNVDMNETEKNLLYQFSSNGIIVKCKIVAGKT